MMGNRLNKIYEKAMDNYHGGYIEKALEQCEKGISLNLKDVRLLNLKGMLLYIKGDLKGAIAVWQINSHYNNDEISKIYLNDAKKDEENLKLYSLAESDIREFKIDDALEKLEKCRVSDFNSINVNNSLAICYLRKGNYLRAMEFNEKALNINKEGKTALEIKNQINGYLQDPRDEFKSSMKKMGMIILLILISATAIFNVINIGNKDNKDILSNKNDGLVVNEEIMINEEANKSWAIRTYTDELLNFIIFTGCMYNLIDDENFDESNTPWPTKLSNSDFENLHINKLKSQWKLWFNDVIEERCNNINLDKMCVFVNEIYNINDFLELEYTELRECCKKSYPHFIDWWDMQAGGKSAISFYEIMGGSKFCDYIEELECKLNKKAKPFNLYIDIVYTGVPNVLDINDKYIVVTPNGYLNLTKDWWMKKLIKLI